MLDLLRKHLRSWLAPSVPITKKVERLEAVVTANIDAGHRPNRNEIPSESCLLEDACRHWQHGDWVVLTTFNRDNIQSHPDRGKIALLVAAGHQQLGDTAMTKQWIRLAQEWGCTRATVAQIMLVGVHQTLARLAAAIDNTALAERHLGMAIHTLATSNNATFLYPTGGDELLAEYVVPSATEKPNMLVRSKYCRSIGGEVLQLAAELLQFEKGGVVNESWAQPAEIAGMRGYKENKTKSEMLGTEKQVDVVCTANDYPVSTKFPSVYQEWPSSDRANHRPETFTISYLNKCNNPLTAIAEKYGTDKGGRVDVVHPYSWRPHNYTEYYYREFNHCRRAIRYLFECGIGTNNTSIPSNMTASGVPGASLRMWRDFFPNATIYGADIDQDILIDEERIICNNMDQTDVDSILKYWEAIPAVFFDVMIDDGLHVFDAGRCLFEHSRHKLASDGVYIIEDVTEEDSIKYKEYFVDSEFIVDIVDFYRLDKSLKDNRLVVIRKVFD